MVMESAGPRRRLAGVVAAAMLLAAAGMARAADIHFSLPCQSLSGDPSDKEALVTLVNEIGKQYKGGKVVIDGAFPYARSISNVVAGKSQVHMALPYAPLTASADLPFRYLSPDLFNVTFVLYTNKNSPQISVQNLRYYRVETERGHVELFGFPVRAASSIESALRKVSVGRLDAFVFAMGTTDAEIRRLGLTNIKRQYFNTFTSRMVVARQADTERLDAELSDIIVRLKQSGRYAEIMAPLRETAFRE
ncbi:MAG: hypothetical protein V4724_40550 [Pseudomonadota bacterium]